MGSPKKLPPVKKRGEIKFINFNGFWGNDFENPNLKNINLHIQKG